MNEIDLYAPICTNFQNTSFSIKSKNKIPNLYIFWLHIYIYMYIYIYISIYITIYIYIVFI